MLVPHALKITCHTHVHCDNYIPACQTNPSKVTIRNILARENSYGFRDYVHSYGLQDYVHASCSAEYRIVIRTCT